MEPVSHALLLLVLVVAACIHFAAIGFAIGVLYVSRRESQRLTKAVGVLVLQEADKIRQLITVR